jgi:outer membrane protein assembly factor BamE (lipoprotein component of BamABCDE complex)
MAPIPPPPPPPDAPPPQPKTIALGQTKAQVVAIFGQPQKVANLGTKEIYYYPDMKVVLVKGKVSDIQ